MSSFDISSKMDWQELDNAVNQVTKEITNRYDFKGVKAEIKVDQKQNSLEFWCSEEGKMDALVDVFQSKAIKRGLSILSFVDPKIDSAFGGSVRKTYTIQAGISKDKAKEVTSLIKESRLKVQAQIQDEQIRVTGKNKDDLQAVMALLREKQQTLELPMQFGNYRD